MGLVKEFYSNIYDPEHGSPKQCKVLGKLIMFDTQMLNAFLETPVIIPEEECLTTLSQFLHTYPDHQTITVKLCMLSGQFILNVEGAL